MSDTVAVMSGGRIIQSGAPRDVYGYPQSQAVANFLGSANLIRGRVIDVADGVTAVLLADNQSTIAVPSRADFMKGTSVDVVFRPEDTTTHADPLADMIECAVERVVFQGGTSECQLRLGSNLLRSLIHPSASFCPGDRAWLSIKPERCILFAAGS